MGVCKKCGGRGLFLSVNEDGVCSACSSSELEVRDPLEVRGKYKTTLRISGGSVVLVEKGRETTIPISSIQDCVFEPPKNMSSGALTITTAKAADGFLRLTQGVSIAGGNKAVIYLLDNSEVEYARNIQRYISDFERTPSGEHTSAADEISKFKKLLDDGVITTGEFEAKKKQLLGI